MLTSRLDDAGDQSHDRKDEGEPAQFCLLLGPLVGGCGGIRLRRLVHPIGARVAWA